MRRTHIKCTLLARTVGGGVFMVSTVLCPLLRSVERFRSGPRSEDTVGISLGCLIDSWPTPMQRIVSSLLLTRNKLRKII